MAIQVTDVRAGLRTDSPNVPDPTPRLSWRIEAPAGWMPDWTDVQLDGATVARLDGNSVLVDWPFAPIAVRTDHELRVRVGSNAGDESPWSEPTRLFAAFLDDDEWHAPMIGLAGDFADATPCAIRTEFTVRAGIERATLYATAHGVYQFELNGRVIDDAILKPGWTAYRQRLVHETTDVTRLIAPGRNAIGATLAGGWFTEVYLGRKPAYYGTVPAVAMQLRLDYEDGAHEWVSTDGDWAAHTSPYVVSGLYHGDDYDARLEEPGWSEVGFDAGHWSPARIDSAAYPAPSAQIAPDVRVTEEIPVMTALTSASGEPILDFGQNLVGWLRIRVTGQAGQTVTLRHAEVLEHGELGTRPLRGARATDTYILKGDAEEIWEPQFTFHGFRYAQVSGVELGPDAVTAVVVGSDLRRTGWFRSSDERLNQLHENVVWGMRGNFLSVPTDCPQRDERLGWTGDLQVFAPTAAFLFDTSAFLTSWLVDLDLEQQAAGGIVPFVIPDSVPDGKRPTAAWGDAATVVPTVMWEHYGDRGILTRQFDSMRAWADVLIERAGDGLLWKGDFQFGDWLDPAAPPQNPFAARTDPDLIASAYLYRSVHLVAEAAALLGYEEHAATYARLAGDIHAAFGREYVTPSGRMASDAPTAYAVGVQFGLYADAGQLQGMGRRLAELVRADGYRIATGFVGTPLVTDALTRTGHLDAAERLLLQTDNPSWLYPVTMGATTIWERWDSMLEDGTINEGGMTSFNHYALGAVADYLHRSVAGLAPETAGYRTVRIAPRPLRRLDFAEAQLDSPYGRIAVSWRRTEQGIVVDATLPTGTTAVVDLPGRDVFEVASGTHQWAIDEASTPATMTHLDWLVTPLSRIIDDEPAYEAIRATLVDIDPEVAARVNKQVLWTDGFTLDEVLRVLPPGGKDRIEQTLATLNARRE